MHITIFDSQPNKTIPLGGLEGVAGETITAGRCEVFCCGCVASSVTLTLNLL